MGIKVVANLVDWIFGRKALPAVEESPPFDFDKTIDQMLGTIPPCTAKVVIVSPRYGDQHYRCEVIADAVRLAPWAAQHATEVWSAYSGPR